MMTHFWISWRTKTDVMRTKEKGTDYYNLSVRNFGLQKSHSLFSFIPSLHTFETTWAFLLSIIYPIFSCADPELPFLFFFSFFLEPVGLPGKWTNRNCSCRLGLHSVWWQPNRTQWIFSFNSRKSWRKWPMLMSTIENILIFSKKALYFFFICVKLQRSPCNV